MSLVGAEFKKIVSKKYIWILMILIATFYAYIFLGMSDNIGVVYGKKALQPVFQEINEAAYDPKVRAYVVQKNFDVTFQELQPMISPKIAETIQRYEGIKYQGYDVAKDLKEEVAIRIESTIERYVALEDRIEDLKSSPDTPLNRYLLEKYTSMPEVEPSLTCWNNWIDINNSLLPLMIAFVVLLGVSGVYSDEYSSRMHGILLTTKKGRRELFWSKLLASCLFSALCVLIFQVFAAVVHIKTYRLPFRNTPVNSLTAFYMTPNAMYALQFYIMQILCSLLGAVALTGITLCVSSFCRNNLVAFFLSGVLFVVGTLWSQNFEGGYLSSLITLPGEVSTFSLMSLTDVLGHGKVFVLGNVVVPTIVLTILAQVIIFAVAVVLTYVFYTRKEVGA